MIRCVGRMLELSTSQVQAWGSTPLACLTFTLTCAARAPARQTRAESMGKGWNAKQVNLRIDVQLKPWHTPPNLVQRMPAT